LRMKPRVMRMAIQNECTFNSFEDETWYVTIKYFRLLITFQFLWGWNLGSVTNVILSKLDNCFQFLWGWNTGYIRREVHKQFKSLSIPLRMKPLSKKYKHALLDFFQFLWGWNFLHYKVRIRHSTPFNSFEDETLFQNMYREKFAGKTFNSFEDETREDESRNKSRCDSIFQFLWGWNPIYTDKCLRYPWPLSIPLRMKQSLTIN